MGMLEFGFSFGDERFEIDMLPAPWKSIDVYKVNERECEMRKCELDLICIVSVSTVVRV